MFKTRHRILVQLTDIDSEDESNPISSSLSHNAAISPKMNLARKQSSEVEVVDQQTLLWTAKSPMEQHSTSHIQRQLHFDYVGKTADPKTRAQVASLIDSMLLLKHNICLIRFGALRECQSSYLSSILVAEVDKRLALLRANVHNIKLEYHDIRKYDVVSLLGQNSSEPKSKKAQRKVRSRKSFSTTTELLKWLQTEYPLVWSNGQGHDCLDLSISFTDVSRRISKVKFTMLQVYLGQLDNATKFNLQNYLQNPESVRQSKNSLLVECLKEFIGGPEKWDTCLVFNLPLIHNGSLVMNDLLTMANAAYAGAKSISSFAQTEIKLNSESETALSEPKSLVTNALTTTSRSDRGSTTVFRERKLNSTYTEMKRNPNPKRAESLPKSQSKNAQNSSKENVFRTHEHLCKSRVSGNFSNKDFNSLSYWYCKVDEKFSSVIRAMETYYKLKYDASTAKMCGDIKQMMATIDQIETGTSTEALHGPSSAGGTELRLQYEQYKEAVQAFRHLTREIERSTYGELLKVYMKTKNYELVQHAMRFKVERLECYQSCVIEAIKEEVSELSVLKHTLL